MHLGQLGVTSMSAHAPATQSSSRSITRVLLQPLLTATTSSGMARRSACWHTPLVRTCRWIQPVAHVHCIFFQSQLAPQTILNTAANKSANSPPTHLMIQSSKCAHDTVSHVHLLLCQFHEHMVLDLTHCLQHNNVPHICAIPGIPICAELCVCSSYCTKPPPYTVQCVAHHKDLPERCLLPCLSTHPSSHQDWICYQGLLLTVITAAAAAGGCTRSCGPHRLRGPRSPLRDTALPPALRHQRAALPASPPPRHRHRPGARAHLPHHAPPWQEAHAVPRGPRRADRHHPRGPPRAQRFRAAHRNQGR
eukprot:jgi/Ulvmu1/11466/UM077_0009.1